MIVRNPPAWQRHDLRAAQRDRWLSVARDAARAADDAGELHVATAFRVVVTTLELDHLPEPVVHGRVTLKGRAATRERAVALAASGLTARAVSIAVGEPYGTVYAWLRATGVARSRDEWRDDVVKRR